MPRGDSAFVIIIAKNNRSYSKRKQSANLKPSVGFCEAGLSGSSKENTQTYNQPFTSQQNHSANSAILGRQQKLPALVNGRPKHFFRKFTIEESVIHRNACFRTTGFFRSKVGNSLCLPHRTITTRQGLQRASVVWSNANQERTRTETVKISNLKKFQGTGFRLLRGALY